METSLSVVCTNEVLQLLLQLQCSATPSDEGSLQGTVLLLEGQLLCIVLRDQALTHPQHHVQLQLLAGQHNQV